MGEPRYILGIESSCDETAVALVERNGAVRVNAVASQIELHAKFGGVVPEEASRRHLETCLPMVSATLEETGIGWDDIHAIAVTSGPGLIGCLLIGVETAKALAWRHGKPLIAVNHLQAHLHAPFLTPGQPPEGNFRAHLLAENGEERQVLPSLPLSFPAGQTEPPAILSPLFPHVGLIVSGGHTSLAFVESPGRCKTLASTRDDAAGEAYDKVARILGIGFPGGPAVDARAARGKAERFAFTAPLKRRDVADFSFSGLKSAVARKVEELKAAGSNGGENGGLSEETLCDLCAGFQSAAIDALLSKSLDAARARHVKDLLIVGGVAANRGLRRAARSAAAGGLRIWFPHFSLCTDNAAMIAGLAWHLDPLSAEAALELNPQSSIPLDY
ncbi:tRNA (adenosine(37)-N6)-threonylcarbamoyltransferase complex transferase subunit TsaD [Candidatus Sumerlaeota bacterium]|nr:tRNA (adenosine(37)-N6)-threonylcarbamoyltransferase complex transferase subunit TsaD [Candidatus Sumerlaeota bacterium]MBI3735155.1 tRNA (adenosine(37)-N6)-threonylcarbamoyltransferase complex transferase subunit TsaD [Candidatus Sumerlaeota bacterium]